MNKLSKKQTLIIGISVIVVCLLISLTNMFLNRSEKREPTPQEIEAYAAYSIDWQAAVGGDGSDKEIILSLCTFEAEETIGENVYKTYTSDTLGDYLYEFGEMMEIAMHSDMTLYIQYTTVGGEMVTLGYNDQGMCEKAFYDLETDTLFYELNGTAEVWTNFRNGIQWGA